MNPNGVVIFVLGVWVVVQVFAGDALGRLRIVESRRESTPGGGGGSW